VSDSELKTRLFDAEEALRVLSIVEARAHKVVRAARGRCCGLRSCRRCGDLQAALREYDEPIPEVPHG
jgi:hypothetical protein